MSKEEKKKGKVKNEEWVNGKKTWVIQAA